MRGSKRVVFSTSVAQFFAALSISSLPIVYPIEYGSTADSAQFIGNYASVIYAAASVTALFCGVSFFQSHKATVYLLAVLCCSFGVSLNALLEFPFILFAALMLGVGYGVLTPLGTQVVSAMPIRYKGLALSIRQAGVPAGPMVGGALFPFLCLSFSGLTVYLSLAVFCFLIAVVAYGCIQATHSSNVFCAKSNLNSESSFSLVSVVLVVAAGALFAGVQMANQSFMLAYLIADDRYSPAFAGMAVMLFGVGGIIFRVVLGYFSDRFGHSSLLIMANALIGIFACLFVGPWVSSVDGRELLLVAFFLGLSAYSWNGVYLHILSRIIPVEEFGRFIGKSTFVTNIGAMVVPFAYGVCIRWGGNMTYIFIMGSIIYGSCFALMAVFEVFRKKSLKFDRSFEPGVSN